MPNLARETESLPPPSAELVLWRVSVECFVAVVGKRKGQRFLRMMSEKLASEESLAAIIPIRTSAEDAAVRRARRQAIEAWQRFLPVFLARVTRE